MISPSDVVQLCKFCVHRCDEMSSSVAGDGLNSRELVDDVLFDALDGIASSMITAGHGDKELGVRANYG